MEKSPQLLTREEFREQVFSRDGHKCVLCGKHAVDAHHIMDRKLWKDNGYYTENGVSLCEKCHIKAERTDVNPWTFWDIIEVWKGFLPPHLEKGKQYDKWGNVIKPDGSRTAGELFHQEGVQKILKEAGIITKFSPHVKYPRTYHLPDSPNLQNDDRMHQNVDFFEGS